MMELSRRWFLKTALATVVAAQLPFSDEYHRVLFIDKSAHLVTGFIQDQGVIRAKVVNGAWDLMLDTQKKLMYAYSNPVYGFDDIAELKTSHPYRTLTEVLVPPSIGEVKEEDKPRTVMVPKYSEEEVPAWVTIPFGHRYRRYRKLDENGNQVMETVVVPVMKETTRIWDNSKRRYWVEESFDGPGHWEYGGVLTMTVWEQEKYPIVVDPLNGAGVDYNAIIEHAEKKG